MNIQHSLAGKRQQRLYVRYRQIRVFRRQRQIDYTIHALIRASVKTAHFHHMEQTGSQFTPHPLLPHGNTCYYSRIILNSLPLLLFSELFRHNYLRPNPGEVFKCQYLSGCCTLHPFLWHLHYHALLLTSCTLCFLPSCKNLELLV